MTPRVLLADAAGIALAADYLQRGQLVGLPTETVYGLAADARQTAAVARIFAAKGRPSNHPVIVHVAGVQALSHWAINISADAFTLAHTFWPGPLTLILPRAAAVSDAVTGGQNSVGLRCPAHPVAQALLQALTLENPSAGLAAPSANPFGRLSPTTAAHVAADFPHLDLPILDGGACQVGIESTIVDLSRDVPVLLRPGAISRAQLEAALGQPVHSADAQAPRASGTLAAHYAPRKPLQLIEASTWLTSPESQRQQTALLAFESVETTAETAVKTAAEPWAGKGWAWFTQAPRQPERVAQHLYGWLRAMDASTAQQLWVQQPPNETAWQAVNDRLTRAAQP